jgi:23S rRNA (uracil1939-C5)-methyltransferase
VPEVVTIDRLGHRGDGVAKGPEGPIYVPFALPGERVTIERQGERARLLEILEPSVHRAAPPCRHFGRCGGCALQMLALPDARAFKRDMVIQTLAREGIATTVAETIGVHPASRRRAVLTALRVGPKLLLGYNERQSSRIVDIEECPVLSQQLAARLVDMRALIDRLVTGRKPVRVSALLTQSGLDINLEGASPPSPRAIPALAEMAEKRGLARLSVDGEPVLTLSEPVIDVSGVPLVPPPGGFVQASAEAEAAMAGLVVTHLQGSRRVCRPFLRLWHVRTGTGPARIDTSGRI